MSNPNSTTDNAAKGQGFGSGILIGAALGMVGYFLLTTEKGKQLKQQLIDVYQSADLDTLVKNTPALSSTPAATKPEAITDIHQAQEVLSGLKQRIKALTQRSPETTPKARTTSPTQANKRFTKSGKNI